MSDTPQQEAENDFIASIAPDVMGCLAEKRFFDELDDVLCPADRSDGKGCNHTFAISEAILRSLSFDEAEVTDVLSVLKSLGACCDCEVLFNVAENSRLKTRYWQSKAKACEGGAVEPPHHSGT